MTTSRLARVAAAVPYCGIPIAAYVALTRHPPSALGLVAWDLALATIPMVLLASLTWRLVWPRWKLIAKVLLHPCIYALLSTQIGHYSVLIAWVHQGLLGLGGHIWFSRKHGFTWYAVEDPERHVSLSRAMIGATRADAGPRQ